MGNQSFGDYTNTVQRTDQEMRKLLNLTLQSAIVNYDTSEIDRVLRYARANTMLLQLSKEWIQNILRIESANEKNYAVLK